MNSPNSNLAGTKSLLLGMMAEARELKQAAGGSVTDAVAGWLAPQYLLAAREKLDGTENARRWEVLRVFVQDWHMLRRGDHSAARLQLDRERLAFERKCAERARLPSSGNGRNARKSKGNSGRPGKAAFPRPHCAKSKGN
jgi:hypothetical protein